jgi:AraC-like DNA-binding protein
MLDYFHYFPCGDLELAWGYHVSAAGLTHIRPHATYPPINHPDDHELDWTRGRVLSAFQLIVIGAGKGSFEAKEIAPQTITPGQCILLFPGVWHRYKPDRAKGWTEHWFELKGRLLDQYLATLRFNPGEPVLKPRSLDLILSLFGHFHTLCHKQPRGYRSVINSLALTILAEIRSQTWAGEQTPYHDNLVRQACSLLSKTGGKITRIRTIAKQLNISYPTLHRHFVEETGFNPKQYLEQIRLARAAQLLSGSNLSIKEIATRLGYYSAFHFSQAFKQNHQLAPAHWRRQQLAKYHQPTR